jgi:hypothetical protein
MMLGSRMYTQPVGAVNVSTHFFANPLPWPLSNMTGVTASVSWQHGDVGGTVRRTPYAQDLSMWTGQRATASQQAMVQPLVDNAPWTAVQFTPDGIWGAALNTTAADPTAEFLTTTTLEANWQGSQWGKQLASSPSTSVDPFRAERSPGICVDAFGGGRHGFAVELEMAVPFAFHEARRLPSKPAAVYVSLSVYLHTPPGTPEEQSHFIWYSTPLFDFERDVERDHVFIDGSSSKLIISGPISGRSRYNTQTPGSTLTQNATFGRDRLLRFSYEVAAAHLPA